MTKQIQEYKNCWGMCSRGEGNDTEWKPDTKGKKQRTLKWQLHKKCTVSHYLIIFKNNIITLL